MERIIAHSAPGREPFERSGCPTRETGWKGLAISSARDTLHGGVPHRTHRRSPKTQQVTVCYATG